MVKKQKQSADPAYRNCYQLSQKEREELRKIAANTNSKWWDADKKTFRPDSPTNWAWIFNHYNYHCIYCRKDLTTSLEEVVSSTVDHIVPVWLFAEPNEANRKQNLAPTCSLCNSLKGPWAPEVPVNPSAPDSPWNNRKNYIAQARAHIEQVRATKRAEYGKFVGKGTKNLKIWNDPDLD